MQDGNLGNLEAIKDKTSDDYDEDAREASRSSFETENQLASSLITVTLAFVALIATAISTSNVLYVIADFQKWLILAAMIIFCISILSGLVNYFMNMLFHKKVSVTKGLIADRIDDVKTHQELANVNRTSRAVQPSIKREESRNRFLLATQIIMVIVGLILTVAFVASLLFFTTVQEDYTDDLPIYQEIMEDQAAESAKDSPSASNAQTAPSSK